MGMGNWLNGKAKDEAAVSPAAPFEPAWQAQIAPDTRKGITFTKAVKYNAKGRVALIGPAGSGKSYTMLLLARLLAGPNGKIAAIDTEHGSLSKYADVFDFDVIELDSFSPDTFTAALSAAEEAGYDVFCGDSLSHFWTGKDGAFDFVDLAQKRNRDQQGGWKEFRPREREMTERLLASPCHVIVTMQTKNDYQQQMVEGKLKRVKVGLAPVQRDGMEYLFDLVGYMDEENTFITDKTRCPAYAQKAIVKPGPKDFEPLVSWLQGAARAGRITLQPVAQIDIGNNRPNSREAAAYVAQRKLASPTLAVPLAAPWKNMRDLTASFESARERVGEVAYREALGRYGWREFVELRNAVDVRDRAARETALSKANTLYWELDALARQEGK